MSAWLIAMSGPERGRRYRLPADRVTCLGRSPDNDISVSGEDVSRSHCRVLPEERGYRLQDTSRNGTLVNGENGDGRLLADGDVIAVGSLSFAFASRTEEEASREAVTFVDHTRTDHGLRAFGSDQVEPGSRPGTADAEHQLRTLYRVGHLIHAIDDDAELVETLADLIQEVISPERLFVVRELRGELAVVTQRAPNERRAARLSRTILEKCFQEGQRVLCPDAVLDPQLTVGSSVSEQQIRSVMAVPLESQKRVIGALYLDSRQKAHAFGQSDLELLSAIGRQAGVALEQTGLIDDLERLATGSILTLVAAVEAKDAYTRGHSERVAGFAIQIAKQLGVGHRMVERIRLGALLHDVGKIGVPDAVLKKPGALTEEEMDQIREHPAIGERIVRQIDHPRLELAQQIARWHHERPDGRGYPDGLAGDAMPQPARIVGAADAFDAMRSPRPYREALSDQKIRHAFTENRGAQFDPAAADALLELWDRGQLEQPAEVGIELVDPASS